MINARAARAMKPERLPGPASLYISRSALTQNGVAPRLGEIAKHKDCNSGHAPLLFLAESAIERLPRVGEPFKIG